MFANEDKTADVVRTELSVEEMRDEELSPDPLPILFPLSLLLPLTPDTSTNQCSIITAVSNFTRTIIIKF